MFMVTIGSVSVHDVLIFWYPLSSPDLLVKTVYDPPGVVWFVGRIFGASSSAKTVALTAVTGVPGLSASTALIARTCALASGLGQVPASCWVVPGCVVVGVPV